MSIPPTISIVEADLLDQDVDVDVIVNAWNRNIIPWWLLLPQGVSGAIKKRGGTGPFKELRKHGAMPLGSAVLTSAGMLPFKGINYTGLAAGRQWSGELQGVDVAQQGLHAIDPVPVFTRGLVHVTSYKSLAMLGMGRNVMTKFSRDAFGRLDPIAMEAALVARGGKPSIIIANAGEVNAGEFDPIEQMADLAKKYNAWLHVDGAFGLFARLLLELRIYVLVWSELIR